MPNCGIAAKCALAVKSNKLRCVIGGWGAAAAAASPAPMDGELEQPAATSGFWVSGVLFHAHGAVFAEVLSATAAQATQCFHASAQLLHGEKLWFLSPPAIRPAFDGDVTQMQAPHPFPLPPPLLHVSPFLWITVVCAVAAAVCGTGAAVAQQRAGRGAWLQGHAAAPTLRQQPDSLLSRMLLPGHVLVARHPQRCALQHLHVLFHSRGEEVAAGCILQRGCCSASCSRMR